MGDGGVGRRRLSTTAVNNGGGDEDFSGQPVWEVMVNGMQQRWWRQRAANNDVGTNNAFDPAPVLSRLLAKEDKGMR